MVLGVMACGLVCRLREQQERAARLQKAVLAAEEQLHKETEKKQVSPLLWSVGRAAQVWVLCPLLLGAAELRLFS